ncbi:MAG: ferredoxin family protein [Bacteroidaceae bacterium]|nr:ferredoxin family protein [Bacteroidaceae bacterium]
MENKVIICGCASRSIMEAEKVARMAALLKQKGFEVSIVPDLCEMAEDRKEALKALEGQTVIACHERAVNALMAWRGVSVGQTYNLRAHTTEEVAAEMGITTEALDEETLNAYRRQIADLPTDQGHDAWFPIIDRDRCVDCDKCHDFCLFGVYKLDEDGKVQVTDPHSCKNNCPACARTCPQEAVIFPKHGFAPINGGEAQEEQTIKIDTKQLYNQALRERLAARRAGVSLLKKKE